MPDRAKTEMRQLVGSDPPPVLALHTLLSIIPLVNYLRSNLPEQDLIKKRANAAAFVQNLAKIADAYCSEASAPIDITTCVQAYRRAHRATPSTAAVAVQQMYQLIQDALKEDGNYIGLLGTLWVVHEPGCKQDTVQQLLNTQRNLPGLSDLPHIFFVLIDRGDRPRRFINYGTSVKVSKSAGKYTQLHLYDTVAVLMDDCVFSKDNTRWHRVDADSIQLVQDLNHLVSCRAQVLVFQRRM